MFNFNFDQIFGSVFDAKIEIYVGDQLVQSNNLQAPQIVIEQNYISLVQQIISDKSRPMSVKLLVSEDIYDDTGKFVRTLWNSVENYNYKVED